MESVRSREASWPILLRQTWTILLIRVPDGVISKYQWEKEPPEEYFVVI